MIKCALQTSRNYKLIFISKVRIEAIRILRSNMRKLYRYLLLKKACTDRLSVIFL